MSKFLAIVFLSIFVSFGICAAEKSNNYTVSQRQCAICDVCGADVTCKGLCDSCKAFVKENKLDGHANFFAEFTRKDGHPEFLAGVGETDVETQSSSLPKPKIQDVSRAVGTNSRTTRTDKSLAESIAEPIQKEQAAKRDTGIF